MSAIDFNVFQIPPTRSAAALQSASWFHLPLCSGCILATLLALALRANILAALLGTFVGNPLTFPLIAAVSMELGSWILGHGSVPLPLVLSAFSDASIDLWRNFIAVFSDKPVHWNGLDVFWDRVFLPYLVGGLVPGFAAAIAAYVLANPVIAAYQRARVARLKKRFAKKRQRVISRRRSAPAE